MNRWTVGILVGVMLSLLTIPVWAQTGNVSVTNNGAPENTMASPGKEALVMDFTLYVGNADEMVNDHDGTVNASPGDTVITTFPASLKFWDTDGNGYDPGDELYLDDDADGVYTAQADTAIDTDGITTETGPGAALDSILAGDVLTAFVASDNVFFQDANSNGSWDSGECIFLDGDGDSLLDSGEQILNAGTVGNAGINAAGSNLVYYNANGNVSYDDGEDIFDSSASRMTYSAAADTGINAGQDGSFDAPDGAALQQFTRTVGGYTALGLVDVNDSSTINVGDEVVDDIGGTAGAYDGGTDTLNAVTFKNQGTADNNDITVKVYVDDGNGTWDAGETDLGVAGWATDSWDKASLTAVITGGGTRFFVTATVQAAAAIGHTIQMYVPQFNDADTQDEFNPTADEGFFLASGQDLPGSDVVNANVQTIDAPVVNTTRNRGYITIQAAIGDATAGDTITVAAGTYSESIDVNKALNLLGPNATISPNTGSRVAEAIIEVPGAASALRVTGAGAEVKGFTVQASATYAYGASGDRLFNIRADSVLVEHNIVKTTTSTSATPGDATIAIFAGTGDSETGLDGWTITDNLFYTDEGASAGESDGCMDLNAGGITDQHNTVSDNVLIHDNTAGGYGIRVSSAWGNCTHFDITGNTLTNYNAGVVLTSPANVINNILVKQNTVTESKYGVVFDGPHITHVTVVNNTLTDNVGGVYFTNPGVPGTGITVHYNDLSGNTEYGIKNFAGADLDGTLNWWGDTTGPDHAANTDGAGSIASAVNVVYRPWLNGVPTVDYDDPTKPGNKTVQLGTGTTYYWTISDAITAATQTDSTIIVSNGTYAETLTIDKDLTIKSVNGAASTIIEAGTDTTIITVNAGCDLTLGEAAAAKGFTIGFDGSITTPSADKIVHNGDTLNLYGNVINGTTGCGVYVNSAASTGTIAGNTVQGCGTGIYFKNSSDFLVGGVTEAEGNTIKTNVIGVQIDSGSHTFKFNEFLNNTSDGVKITSAASAAGTVFHGTAGNKFDGNTTLAINNTSETAVDAGYCYWGDATGPYAPSNTSGLGDYITADVTYSPWLMSWPNGPLASAYDTATHTFTTGYHDGYNDGWQLLSIPLNAANPAPEAVFDELGTLSIWQYDECQSPSAAYVRPTAVNPTGGYWVYFLGDKAITVEGATIQDQITVTLGCAGWQMIGVPTVAIPITHNESENPGAPDITFSTDGWATSKTYAAARTAGWLDDTTAVWRYDNSTGQYVGVGEYGVLDPWTGYWLKTAVANLQMKVLVEWWLTHAPVPPSGTASYLPMSANADMPPAPPTMPKNLTAAMDKSGLIVYNEPNPIRDVHTTTFKVKSALPIDAIRVEIFNQAGQLVFTDEQLGDELAWHTDNDYGEYLANGVYLYRVSAKVSGQWVITEVRKLAIVR